MKSGVKCVRQESPQSRKVVDQLFRFGPDFVPNWIQLSTNDGIERSKIRVLDVKVIEVELDSKVRLCTRIAYVGKHTEVFERFSSDKVDVMHCMIAS